MNHDDFVIYKEIFGLKKPNLLHDVLHYHTLKKQQNKKMEFSSGGSDF